MEIYEFGKAYQEWLNKGAPEKEPFSRAWGLCDSTYALLSPVNRMEMRKLWLNMNLHVNFPFNVNSTQYFSEGQAHQCHLNPLRNQFIQVMIQMEPKKQSDQLTEYYQVLYQWLDSGAPEGQPFSLKRGIVQNMLDVLGDNPAAAQLQDEMQMQFLRAKKNVLFPFNKTDQERIDEINQGTVYANQQRLQWIADHQ